MGWLSTASRLFFDNEAAVRVAMKTYVAGLRTGRDTVSQAISA
jgi:hypothetical protein